MRRVPRKFNKIRLVLLIVLFIAFCTMNIIFKTQSRFRTLEEKNIVSVSEVPFYGLAEYDDYYFIDKDNNVYRLINKELSEINELKGAKKIIRTLHETIILMADNSLWEYDKDTNILKRVDGFDNCADISNGDAFFSVLNKDGTVWLSWDILNDDEYKGREMTKLSLPKKAVQIDCCMATEPSAILKNKSNFLLVTILDEDGDVWLAG